VTALGCSPALKMIALGALELLNCKTRGIALCIIIAFLSLPDEETSLQAGLGFC